MQEETNHELEDELRPESDFTQMGQGIRGKYVDRYQAGTNNEALRLLMQIALRQKSNPGLTLLKV
jgi:hypothetical protein